MVLGKIGSKPSASASALIRLCVLDSSIGLLGNAYGSFAQTVRSTALPISQRSRSKRVIFAII
jgi:hypothetical protein